MLQGGFGTSSFHLAGAGPAEQQPGGPAASSGHLGPGQHAMPGHAQSAPEAGQQAQAVTQTGTHAGFAFGRAGLTPGFSSFPQNPQAQMHMVGGQQSYGAAQALPQGIVTHPGIAAHPLVCHSMAQAEADTVPQQCHAPHGMQQHADSPAGRPQVMIPGSSPPTHSMTGGQPGGIAFGTPPPAPRAEGVSTPVASGSRTPAFYVEESQAPAEPGTGTLQLEGEVADAGGPLGQRS